ncbi:serine protease [Tabrizicola sp.]|uniref:trypsin-like serine peptidase n=1 Tax=Tabrizicola sp. TaxID=2005166 RepID=UPI0027347873|nr:serine protease [Tabrizicola sp.]MDP3195511.1 serine protease [Tabrizicola sp.]
MRAVVALFLLAGAAAAQGNSGLVELVTREELRGFEPVGRVDIADGGFCTGALIAADLVLTAGHCVLDRGGVPVAADRITFRAGLAYGTALVEARVVRTIVDPAYRNLDPVPVEMIDLDVALLQLAEPVPSAVISPFVVARPANGDKVSVVSYAEGRHEALSWQRVCKVVGREDRQIAVDCDVTHGSSGAPVLERSGYRAKIVSMISAGGEWDGQTVSFGMELPEQVARLKAALRSGQATSEAKAAPDEGRGAAVTGMPGKPSKRITSGSGASGGAKFLSP